jgi:Uncharacterised nucleotidyltransferase
MDLQAEAERLRLDLLAVQLSSGLSEAGLPHALLKGPSTANWLYDPPRPYQDVDLLVPLSRVEQVVRVLSAAGLARSRSGVLGEEAPHSWLLHSAEGFEVDLHISLPAVPADGDRLWHLMEPHVEPLVLDVGTLPALDEVGRCLVLALHCLMTPVGKPAEDLKRARHVTDASTWAAVQELAVSLGVADLVEAGLSLVGSAEAPLSRRAHLYLVDAPDAAFGLERLARARRRDLPRLVWRELFPSRGFMAHDARDPELRGRALVSAHLSRWRRLARQLPAAFRAFRS